MVKYGAGYFLYYEAGNGDEDWINGMADSPLPKRVLIKEYALSVIVPFLQLPFQMGSEIRTCFVPASNTGKRACSSVSSINRKNVMCKNIYNHENLQSKISI